METSFVTETTALTDGSYYVPYLIPGNYRITVSASGFKEFVREGLNLRSAEVPRVDIILELGSISESVTVSAAASLLNTENVASAYVLPAEVLKEVPGVMKRTIYLMQYMPGVIAVQGQAGFHIAGQATNDIGASLDGITAKSPYTGAVNNVDGVIQGSTEAMEEVKVLTTGVSAEYGHSSGGSMTWAKPASLIARTPIWAMASGVAAGRPCLAGIPAPTAICPAPTSGGPGAERRIRNLFRTAACSAKRRSGRTTLTSSRR
jgi:hypothetical protein